MFSAAAACAVFAARPLRDVWGRGHLRIMSQALLAGSALALNLFYFAARMKDEKPAMGVAFGVTAAMWLFPEYVWGTLGGVFGGLDPTVSALSVFALGATALNVGLHAADALSGRRASRPGPPGG